MPITDSFTFQRLIFPPQGSGQATGDLVLLNKEGRELGRAAMPSDLIAWHEKLAKKEREILGLSLEEEMDLEVTITSDEEGRISGYTENEQGLITKLTRWQCQQMERLHKSGRKKEATERQIFGLLIAQWHKINEPEPGDTETEQ